MALTITIEGKGVIANSDSTTADTGGTGTGTWDYAGQGSMSVSTETYLYGTSCVAWAWSNKAGWSYFDIGTGNELDFTASTGTEADQFIYMWIFFPTPGLGETAANGGFTIRLGTDTSNYRDFMVSASDELGGWYGDWKCFVIDPNKPGTDTGTFDVASIAIFGCYLDATDTAKGDNLFIDQIAVGSGLRITGTSTTAWKDVMEYCTDYPNRAWGMVQEREGVYYVYGKMYIGDSTSQAADVSFVDSARVIQFGVSRYYYSSAWVSTFPADASGIVVEDIAAYTTDFTDGVIVGTDNGRSGSVIIGNTDQDVSLDLYGGNHADSVTALYGSSLKDLTGPLVSGNDTGHKFLGVSFIGCAQFDPVGACVIRNCTFAETGALPVSGQHDSALLWNSNIDIQNCKFIANTDTTEDPHAIEFDTAGTYSFTDMLFSGNDYDIENSVDATVLDSYSESNFSGDNVLGDTYSGYGQSFDDSTGGFVISSARFYLKKVGSPTGTVVAKLYGMSGTYGLSSIPDTGKLHATSETIDVSTLGAISSLVKFDFKSGYTTGKIKFVVTIEYAGGDASNYIGVGVDSTTPSHGGNASNYTSSWAHNSNQDLVFYMDYGGLVTINATDSDPTTHEETGTPKGTTNIVTSVDLTMTVKDEDGAVTGAYAYIDDDNITPFIMNTTTNASGIATVSHGGGAVAGSTWRIRKYGYKPYYATVDIGSSNINLPVTLIKDPQQT